MKQSDIRLPASIANQLAQVEKCTKPFLERILVTFPQFTDHGPEHSRRLVTLLFDVLLDDDNVGFLEENPWTYFFLLASAHLHDMGMVDFPCLQPADGSHLSAEEIRRSHGARGAAIVRERWSDFGLDDEFQARIISEIIEHHTGPLEPKHLVATRAYETETINVGFCVACIRLADELDLPKQRTDRRLAEFITDPTSDNEWKTHYSIGGVIRHPQLKQAVLVECCCNDKDVHRKLKGLETKINGLLALITMHVDPRLQYAKCIFDIAAEGYVDKDLKFLIDENSLWPMIVGDILYHDNRTFIRELVQNAIDACLLRKHREGEYQPRISLRYTKNAVSVTDNGTGMDLGMIEKYLVRICLSFYGSERFASERESLHYFPISRFGIGIFSCFMVSEEVRIKTSTGNGTTYYLTVRDYRDYVQIEERQEVFQGTEVFVELRTLLKDVISYVRDTFRFTDLEIDYQYPLGDREVVGRRPFSRDELVMFGNNKYLAAKEYRVPFASSTGLVWFFDEATTKEAKDSESSFLLLMNGVKVGYFSLLPAWCTLRQIEGVVNLRNEERIDITASRNDVVRNNKYEQLVGRMEGTVLEALRDWLTETKGDPIEARRRIRAAIKAERATVAVVPILEEYYHCEVHPVSEVEGKFKPDGPPSLVPFLDAVEHFRHTTGEELIASMDRYDLKLANLVYEAAADAESKESA